METTQEKNPAAVALGRSGGLKRASSLTAKKRREIAKKAGKASGRARTKRAKQNKGARG
jgi:hypothetical protein